MLIGLVLIGAGILLISWGIRTLWGPVNVWLVDFHGWGYAFIPVGLLFVCTGLALLPFFPITWRLPITLIGSIAMLIGFLIPRRWLDPEWMRWLKSKHKQIMPLLQQEIDEMGYHEWNRQINNQKDLEEWVNRIEKKYSEV